MSNSNKQYLNKSKLPLILVSTVLTIFAFNLFASEKPQATLPTKAFIQFNASSLASAKKSIQEKTAANQTKNAYKYLIRQANQLLTISNPTVMNKTIIPPSNDKHDYLSISRYWWPDPNSADGLPWIRKDGITNPSTQNDDVDRNRLGKTMKAIKLLSLAYYFSDDEKYAQKGVSLINTWFLDEKTKMNPHLTYGQSVPGNPKGRRSGILDGRLIPQAVLDAMTIFSTSPSWTQTHQTQMTAWLSSYLQWLTTSKLGISGSKQKNNHGSWYRFQVASLAWYLGDKKLLNEIIATTQQSLSVQFNKQGIQEHEVKRTRGFFYSCFNLQALTLIANIAENSDTSLWQYKSPNGHSIKLAVDYLMPVTRGEKWPHASNKIQLSRMAPVLASMVEQNQGDEYKVALKKVLKGIDEKIQNKSPLNSNQKDVHFEFALLRPNLVF